MNSRLCEEKGLRNESSARRQIYEEKAMRRETPYEEITLREENTRTKLYEERALRASPPGVREQRFRGVRPAHKEKTLR